MTTTPTRGFPIIRVFVDYWNFQLTLNEREASARNLPDFRFSVDWVLLGRWLAEKSRVILGVDQIEYGACHLYSSIRC